VRRILPPPSHIAISVPCPSDEQGDCTCTCSLAVVRHHSRCSPPQASSAPAAATPQPAAVPGDDAPQSFYLAINKRELGQRWSLSAYVKQYHPDNVNYGAAASLGVRVVTFRVQNGKLFVFDASDHRHRVGPRIQ
jgi:hypothetical protein